MLACEKWHPCRDSLTEIDNALQLISIIREKITTSSEFLKAVLRSISSSVVSDKLRQYVYQVPGLMCMGSVRGHNNLEVCPLSYREAQTQLHQCLAMMVLESALASQRGGHFDPAMMRLLLRKQCLHCQAQPESVECAQRRPRSLQMPKISLFEAINTPRVESVSLNWRDSLIRELSRDADCRYEGVVRMVGEICRDLESRCNESERPLREEKSKSRDLQARLESAERDKGDLELQTRNRQSQYSALQIERDRLAEKVEVAERQMEELGTRLNNINREAECAAQTAIERTRQQDLAYLATITGKDEMFEEQSLKLTSAEQRVQLLEDELSCMREQEVNNAEKVNNDEKRIGTLNIAISASECRIRALQDEITQTKEQDARNIVKISSNEAIIDELKSTILASNDASDQKESLISTLRDRLQNSELETSELRLQHETYLSAKDAEIECLKESIRSSNETWLHKIEVAHKSAAAVSEQSAATIASLRSKVGKLRKEREVCNLVTDFAFSEPRFRPVEHTPSYRNAHQRFASRTRNADVGIVYRSGIENLQKLKS